MKRIAILLSLLATLTLTACESERTIDGKTVSCAGLNQEPTPGYQYKLSARNIIVGVLFAQLIAPPVIVALEEYKCPVAAKP